MLLLGAALAHGPLCAAPEWRHAANHDLKLHGGVLLGDERGTYWDERLPDGWVWLGPPNTPFEKPGPGFLECDQLLPVVENGAVVFETSKWNFLTMGLNAGLSGEELGRRLVGLEGAKTFRFRRDPGITGATALFEGLDPAAASKALESPVKSTTVPLTDFGVLALRTRGGKVVKLLVENFSMTTCLSWACLEGEGSAAKFGAKTVLPGRRQGDSRRDLDGDGEPDLGWSESDGAHKPLGGATLALVKIFKYP